MRLTSVMHQILDLARWAPSGDNTQPWRFEILDEQRLVIHGRDTRSDCVYDLDGRPSQLSLGALIETIDIAASGFGLTAMVRRRDEMPDTHPTFDVTLLAAPDRPPSDLLACIPLRSVFRRPMALRPILEVDRSTLKAAVGSDHDLIWMDSWAARLRWASMLWANAGLRLRLPEAFEVHRRVIEWHARFSIDRMPDQALGASAATLMIMRWAMTNWQRVKFLNTWMGGTLAPRIEMDWIPALACGAHIVIVARQPPQSVDDYVAAGRAVQRFWLAATRQGLLHQPAMTPLIFSRYVQEGRRFTNSTALQTDATRLSRRFGELLGSDADKSIWAGRIGYGRQAPSRSQRKALQALF